MTPAAANDCCSGAPLAPRSLVALAWLLPAAAGAGRPRRGRRAVRSPSRSTTKARRACATSSSCRRRCRAACGASTSRSATRWSPTRPWSRGSSRVDPAFLDVRSAAEARAGSMRRRRHARTRRRRSRRDAGRARVRQRRARAHRGAGAQPTRSPRTISTRRSAGLETADAALAKPAPSCRCASREYQARGPA